jgi:hypothetical protein
MDVGGLISISLSSLDLYPFGLFPGEGVKEWIKHITDLTATFKERNIGRQNYTYPRYAGEY